MRLRIVLIAVALFLSSISPGLERRAGTGAIGVPCALAQETSPAQEEPRAGGGGYPGPVSDEQARARSRFRYLTLGYGLIWIALGVFVVGMTRKVDRVRAEIQDLSDRLEATPGGRRG